MKIKISYQTGDSFNTYDTKEYLEYEWDNLDIIKQNVDAIVAHNKFVKEISEDRWMGNEEIEKRVEEAKTNWWFVEKLPWDKTNICSKDFVRSQYIYLKKDDGTLIDKPYSCFWIGWFEHLKGVYVDTNIDVEV
jgi:hypothetical protein